MRSSLFDPFIYGIVVSVKGPVIAFCTCFWEHSCIALWLLKFGIRCCKGCLPLPATHKQRKLKMFWAIWRETLTCSCIGFFVLVVDFLGMLLIRSWSPLTSCSLCGYLVCFYKTKLHNFRIEGRKEGGRLSLEGFIYLAPFGLYRWNILGTFMLVWLILVWLGVIF